MVKEESPAKEEEEETKSDIGTSEKMSSAASDERQNGDGVSSGDKKTTDEPKNQEAKQVKCFIRVKPEYNISRKRKRDEDPLCGNVAASTSVGPSTVDIVANATNVAENQDSNNAKKKKRNHCAICRRKVGLTGFTCRCGGLYCGFHRYSDKHDCTFNYRELGAEEIRRNNPVVIGEKIRKI